MAIRYTVSSKAVRRSLLILFPLENNLIVGDFFQEQAEFLQYTDKATELIGWL